MTARDVVLPVLMPGTPVLARADRRIHVGSDPASALVLELAPSVSTRAVAGLIQQMRAPVHYRHLRRHIRNAGLSAADFWSLLDQLVASGKAAPPQTPRTSIGVIGHGEIADRLAASLTDDGFAVSPVDPSTPPRSWPALLVVTDQPVADPAIWAPLMAAGAPHLSVHVCEGDGIVGPLVLPGSTGCLRCIDLHRADLDPEWPVLAAALQGVAGGAATATVSGTVALAHAQIVEITEGAAASAADSVPPRLIGHVLRLRHRPTRLESLPAPAHRRCSCTADTE
ncbi:hypothetical protein [Gordonia shandongensis]|uniref:hypothetical protein n=1 Tax=Gordonia shandongensis TaxID=376351 RepID=UPI00041A8F30|nr:hypothetical protein [Gordonia shandongensis]